MPEQKSNFWLNPTFEPKRQFRFLIEMSLGGQSLTFLAKSAGRPNYSISENPHQFFNHTFYYPGRVTWNTIDVTFVDPVVPDQSAVITNMFVEGGYTVPTTETNSRDSFSKQKYVGSVGTPKINQIDADGQIIETWTLNNAFITSIDYGQLDYSVEDLVIVSITLRYDYATFTNPGAQPASKLTLGGV